MDELTPEELRGKATAANLRRAFGAPAEGDAPAAFGALLARLAEIRPAADGRCHQPPPRSCGSRLGS